MMSRIGMLLPLIMLSNFGIAAGDHYDNMGKLNTVVICVAVILIGIALFLFYLERRISKIEQSSEDDQYLSR